MNGIKILLLLLWCLGLVSCRNHQLVLLNDARKYFRISTFGFLDDGRMEVNLDYLTFTSTYESKLGFTLTKTISDSITPYMEGHQTKCLLTDDSLMTDGNVQIVSFLFDLKHDKLLVNCSRSLPFLEITSGSAEANTSHTAAQNRRKRESSDVAAPTKTRPMEKEIDVDLVKKGLEVAKPAPGNDSLKSCSSFSLPFKDKVTGPKRWITGLQFVISMTGHDAEGLYSLYFHNCANDDGPALLVNLSILIIERNGDNYLSAGEMPLPKLYFMMSLVFFFTGCVWLAVLRHKREKTFKIHYLMGLLVFVKALSLLFHGINYHNIAKDGYPMEAWAVLYYITHLLKGALLFITIVLIGTGWAFIKHILSDKDKKIFMIVIPLQVLANVAKIIMEESEEGNSQHSTWREIFILVDLVCCGAILFPVVWSIRHLQEASQTDGKAAINLEKLKLFRHFYVMIVCYIYFTRIIVYLLKITVPFQYEWLDEVFRETATITFFIVTGINFQPTASNPYFRLTQEDDLEMDEVVTQTGFTESISKTLRARDSHHDEDDDTTVKRESSHEYD